MWHHHPIDALPSTTVRVPRRFRWTRGVLRRTDESYEGAGSPPRRRIVGAAATRLPHTIHRCDGRTPRVHRDRRGTRIVVEGRASIVTSPGGTAAPGSWIHHVGVLNADRVLVRRRRALEETRRRRWHYECKVGFPQRARRITTSIARTQNSQTIHAVSNAQTSSYVELLIPNCDQWQQKRQLVKKRPPCATGFRVFPTPTR